jgi:hypothetical protein
MILTIPEHDAEKAAWPHCDSREIKERRRSAFSAVSSKKSF